MVTRRRRIGSKGGDGVEINGNCSKVQKRISNYCKGNCSGGSSLNAVNKE